MRDPMGALRIAPTTVHRSLYQPLPPDHFLLSEAAAALVAAGQLIAYSFDSPTAIVSPRIGFVTYPHEWCNAQFVDAAELTLAVSEAALASGHELKDASAWNILFNGCKPVFCDHLSFQKINDQRWWAFAQFVRHFILPLCLAKYRRLDAAAAFAISRDGMSPELARKLMGMRRFVTRYWLLLLKPGSAAAAPALAAGGAAGSHHRNLYGLTRWLLAGVRKLGRSPSTWLNYTAERSHYSDDASRVKYQVVDGWLGARAPAWVVDLGCNTGEFSRLAASHGAQVVAVDLDHESIQALYLASRDAAIYPVLANLDDLSGGRGWGGTEFPGLLARLSLHAEVLMMLAVVHHLAISSSIPYEVIAATAAGLTTRYLIIELLDEADPLVARLAAQRGRVPAEFSLALQRRAFEQHFQVLETVALPASSRVLHLMEKR